ATDERIANARQTQALELYAATALTAFQEVEDALSNEQALARQAGALSRAVNQLRQALDVEQQRYEAGEIGIDRVDDARLRFFNARRDLVNVRVAQLRQRVQLHLALGGSFEDAPEPEAVLAVAVEG
ncbi:MAG: TolC family protein, partial [Pseudomonadota bacterium]